MDTEGSHTEQFDKLVSVGGTDGRLSTRVPTRFVASIKHIEPPLKYNIHWYDLVEPMHQAGAIAIYHS